MLILFGTRGATRPVIETDMACPGCQKRGLCLVPVQNYFHIFFIPTFPIGRDFHPVCPHCEAQFSAEGVEITPELYELAPVPWWAYLGGGLLGLFILLGVIQGKM